MCLVACFGTLSLSAGELWDRIRWKDSNGANLLAWDTTEVYIDFAY
jgi:hypothetical protein